ncbi:MAG: hypothetical protein U0Q47_10495 [Mycobacterium sp.]
MRNPRSESGAVRGVVLGTLTSVSIATALISADVAEASCTMVRGTGDEARCASDPTNFAERLDEKSSVSAQGRLGGPRANAGRGDGVSPAPTLSPSAGNSDTGRAAGDAVTVAESMLGTDMFGDYGCEDFVDAAYGLTTETGMGHDAALAFYQSMADRGLDHHETPIPRGALVFSAGPDGNHVDISRGDGTYVSGGVQGISPGYGDGHNVQILPAPNLGAWTMYGWVYAPW